ncbi:TonB-dependent receptor [Neolewinella persica]|uniref:TonB-dependent receptor plug domain-containing protein n=1 Tax=Neolewinella persica TaxID=70998 RepID=UPI0003809A1F|nr:TonB-dependent receptor plug domain-containing protein [Neolewinella persica]
MKQHYFLALSLLSLFALSPLLGQDTLSFGGIYELPGAEVRATYTPVSPLAQSFTIEEVYRLPGTFYDPARLVALLPGVVQTNDQANHLSVRGNTPNANLWRINGLAIVNPNHTANAGTFYDFPTLNGGGVNAISAQMLDNSGFLAGGLPVEYGFATGGTFDLRLRPGSKTKRKYQAQAGFIGFDLMAEGPIGASGQTSYLVNGRYSFTGLLADMGVDFGGEEIRFADFNGHLHHQWEGGELSLFGIYGNSSNNFAAPDPAEEDLTEQKELFNIDFTSQLSIVGLSASQQVGAGTVTAGFSYSETAPERDQSFREEDNGTADLLAKYRFVNANLQYRQAISDKSEIRVGAEWLEQSAQNNFSFNQFGFNGGTEFFNFFTSSSAISPYVGLKTIIGRTTLDGGLRYERYSGTIEGSVIAPRLNASFGVGKSQINLTGEVLSRAPLLTAGNCDGCFGSRKPIATYQLSAAYGTKLGTINTRATVFYQYSPDDLAANVNGYLVSASSVLEPDPNLNFSTEAQSQRYGLELEASGGLKTKGWYYRGSITLLNAETFQTNGGYQKDRYAVDFITKLTLGREWPGMDRKERQRSYGLNLALVAHGGERYGTVNNGGRPSPINIRRYFTGQSLSAGFVNDLGTYFRPDLRLYKTKTRAKTTTTLALDLQNVAGIENVGNVYYDAFLERPNERLQLGLIPVLSYRIVWR